MDISRYNDLINPRNPVPQAQKQKRSWELGLQMVNHKKIDRFYQPYQMNSDHTFRWIAKANIN